MYFVERLRSFGDRDQNEFALKIEHLLAIDQEYTPQQTNQFPKPNELIDKIRDPRWLLVTGDFLNNRPRHSQMYMSKAMA